MTRSKQDVQVAARLAGWIDENYGGRGKFAALESASSISAQRWKNLYYGRQGATAEMLTFVEGVDAAGYSYLMLGVRAPLSSPSLEDQVSIGSRLKWAIRQWCGPMDSDPFALLERKCKGDVSAKDWANWYLSNTEPTAAMIAAACRELPQYVEWVFYGELLQGLQVDPTGSRWVKPGRSNES